MTLLQGLLLGIVQGATEFLPISSSGHLVLVPWVLGWQLQPQTAFLFDVLVQMGTLLAVLAYFRADLLAILRAMLRGRPGSGRMPAKARLGWLLLLASLPGAAGGLLLKGAIAASFEQPVSVSAFLLLTALLLFLAEWLGARRRTLDQMTALDALWVGLAQTLALFPGVSRSGATLAGGMLRQVERAEAARFSFLMAVPIMLGAGAVALLDLSQAPLAAQALPPIIAGFISSAAVGYAAVHWLLGYLQRRSLVPFAIYCLVVGLAGLLAGGLGG